MPTYNFRSIDVPDAATPYTYIGVTGLDLAGEAVGYYGYSDGDGDSSFHGFIANRNSSVGMTYDPSGSSNTDGIFITSAGTIYGDYVDIQNKQNGFIDSGDGASKFTISNQYTIVSGLDDAGNLFGDFQSGNIVISFVQINGTYSTVDVSGPIGSTTVSGVGVRRDR